ncbi:uncharacterized protein LOC107635529 [Arachis ipaensis]|uniref:Transmembrane protein 33 homolog n=1 Tax=Arachis hypogaea TaxID=3818 RepID=A0A444WP01_ARAHY|nr:uncharacterized protein LOC107635529 [Arachis ipaensis]XP_025650201.1 uncharacterized protein LOC112744716 [Arachis hypogaea]RYQ78982.1 hypothetical protein Ahy_Scaffold8g108454 [Arachis hypogaea]
MGDEAQRAKREAAASYDYDGDSRWADYWANVLIPPNMASRPDVINHFKHKFYQRYIDPDLVVEPMSSTSSSRSSSTTSSSTTSSNTGVRSRSNSGRSSGSGTYATQAPNAAPLRWDRQTVQFSVNAWVFVVAVLSLIPLVPGHLSNRAYRLSFLGTTCSSLFSLYSLYGKPTAWNLQGLQIYFQTIIATKDFITFVYCLSFVTSHLCLKLALIPIICRALEHVAKFLRRNFSRSTLYRKYLEEPCVWVESNNTTLNILASHAEIGLGFLLIISLFSWQRNIIQTFMYWQLLKLMYQAPVTSAYHRNVWATIGRTFIPFIHRYAPFLDGPISAVQRWWFR